MRHVVSEGIWLNRFSEHKSKLGKPKALENSVICFFSKLSNCNIEHRVQVIWNTLLLPKESEELKPNAQNYVCIPSFSKETAVSTTSSTRMHKLLFEKWGQLEATQLIHLALWGPRGQTWKWGCTIFWLWDLGQATWLLKTSVSSLVHKDNNAYFCSSLGGREERKEEAGEKGKARKRGRKEVNLCPSCLPKTAPLTQVSDERHSDVLHQTTYFMSNLKLKGNSGEAVLWVSKIVSFIIVGS